MSPCPACAAVTPPSARFCPSCGARMEVRSGADWDVTMLAGDATKQATNVVLWPSSVPPSSRTSSKSSRFVPGAIVAGRYRLVALLGQGGMGEVYRADDLMLDHPVALKFLQGIAADARRLTQFHHELRV